MTFLHGLGGNDENERCDFDVEEDDDDGDDDDADDYDYGGKFGGKERRSLQYSSPFFLPYNPFQYAQYQRQEIVWTLSDDATKNIWKASNMIQFIHLV